MKSLKRVMEANLYGRKEEIMRTFNYFFVLFLMCTLVSCTTDSVDNESISPLPNANSRRIFTATIEQADTRLEFDGRSFMWEKGDSICVYPVMNEYGVDSWEYFAAMESGSSVRFAQLPSYDGVYRDVIGDEFLAFYPETLSGDYVDFAKDSYSFYITPWADAKSVSKPAIAGYTAGNKINFKNVGTMYKVRIASDNVTSLELRGQGISGKFFIQGLKSGVVTSTPYENNYDYIEVTGKFEKDKTYYISACPNTSQLSMYINGDLYKSLNAPMQFERNKIYNLGEVFKNHRIYFTDEIVYNISADDIMNGTVGPEDVSSATITLYDEAGNKIPLADGGVMQKPLNMENQFSSLNVFYYYDIPRELTDKTISFSVKTSDPQRRGTERSLPFVANRDFYTYTCESKLQPDQILHPINFSLDYYIWELQGEEELYGDIYVRGDIPWDELYVYVLDSNNKILTDPYPGTKVSGEYQYVNVCPDGNYYYCLSRYLWDDITDYVYVTFNDGKGNKTDRIKMWLNFDRCYVINQDYSCSEILAPYYNWDGIDIKTDYDRYTVYLYNGADWNGVNIYAYDNTGKELCGGAPGAVMKQFEGDSGYYYSFPRTIKGANVQFVFSNGEDASDQSEESLPIVVNTNIDLLLHNATYGNKHPLSFYESVTGAIYVRLENVPWEEVYIYAWDEHNNPLCGTYPGEQITYVSKFEDGHSYYEYQLYMPDIEMDTKVNILFNNGHSGNENQTTYIRDVYIGGSHCYVITPKSTGTSNCNWREIASPRLQWEQVW